MGENEIIYCKDCIHCYYDLIYNVWKCDTAPMNEYDSIEPNSITCENAEKNTED